MKYCIFLFGVFLNSFIFAADIEDPLGRENPRSTMDGYLKAIQTGDNDLAGEYLDLRNLPRELDQYTPGQLAFGLSVVLDRSSLLTLESYSEDALGESNDGLPSYRDLLAEILFKGDPQRLFLQRVPEANEQFIWKISNATIAQLPDLYDEYRYTAYVEWLYDALPETKLLGVLLFKWVAALTISLAIFPFVLGLAWWISRLLVKPDLPMHSRVRRFFMGPCSVFILVKLAVMILQSFGGANVRDITRTHTISTLVVLWLVYSAVDLIIDIYAGFLRRQGRESSIPLLKPVGTSVKVIFILLAMLVWLDNVGYSITALLTGLGVGGIAVALVLQKPLEDIFGAITLYTQQPIKIGNFGRFGNVTGTIEDISLRTTRIRTLDNTVVAIPNMSMASKPIENYSARHKILYKPSILLSNTTRPEQIQNVLNKVRHLLDEDELVLGEGARVNFTEIGAEGFELKVFAYVNTTDFPAYLLATEVLNFGILGIIDEEGVTLQRAIADLLK